MPRALSHHQLHRSIFAPNWNPPSSNSLTIKTFRIKSFQIFKRKAGERRRMHSLSFKVSTDYCTGTARRCFPGRGSYGVADLEVRTTRVGLGFRDFGKAGRIVACSSESERKRSNGWSGSRSSSPTPGPGPQPSSFLSRSQSYALLKQQMEVAAKSEVSNLASEFSLSFSLLLFSEGLKFWALILNWRITKRPQEYVTRWRC